MVLCVLTCRTFYRELKIYDDAYRLIVKIEFGLIFWFEEIASQFALFI